MSAHITKQLGMAPGGEFRTAFHEVCFVHIFLFLWTNSQMFQTFSEVFPKSCQNGSFRTRKCLLGVWTSCL